MKASPADAVSQAITNEAAARDGGEFSGDQIDTASIKAQESLTGTLPFFMANFNAQFQFSSLKLISLSPSMAFIFCQQKLRNQFQSSLGN